MSDSDPRAAWVLRVLGVEIDAAASFGNVDEIGAELYRGLVETVQEDLRTLSGVDPSVVDAIGAMVDSAARLARQGEFRTAFAGLEQAAETMARARSAARMDDIAGTVPTGIVSSMVFRLETARARWNAALDDARAESDAYATQLAENFPLEAMGYRSILESYWSDLSALLAGADADPVLQTAGALREELQADALFDELETKGVPARSAFLTALDQIEKLLQA